MSCRSNGQRCPQFQLGVARGDCVDLLVLSAPAALVFDLACEDDVGGVFIRELILDGSDCWSSSRLLGGLEAAGREVEAAAAPRPWRSE